ncbi:hypothetical protein TNCV_116161 [Trichonephila clavipes]|nr:hypothetical protein TNCV_116161 [Trichonephila clavipes]
MNQHLDTYHLNLSPQHNGCEFYRQEENPKFHHPFATSEYSQMDLGGHEMNPQFDVNQLTVSSEYNQNGMLYRRKEFTIQCKSTDVVT